MSDTIEETRLAGVTTVVDRKAPVIFGVLTLGLALIVALAAQTGDTTFRLAVPSDFVELPRITVPSTAIVPDQLVHPARGDRDAVLVVLDLAGDADQHDDARPSRRDTASRAPVQWRRPCGRPLWSLRLSDSDRRFSPPGSCLTTQRDTPMVVGQRILGCARLPGWCSMPTPPPAEPAR